MTLSNSFSFSSLGSDIWDIPVARDTARDKGGNLLNGHGGEFLQNLFLGDGVDFLCLKL